MSLKRINLTRLNNINLAIIFFAILLFGGTIAKLMTAHRESLINQREKIVVALAKESLSQDLRLGLISEVYRKCKSLYQNHGLIFIEIKDSSNKSICNFGTPTTETSSGALYFDKGQSHILGSLNLGFKASSASETERTTTAIYITLLLLIVVTTIFGVRRLYVKSLSEPLDQLHTTIDALNTGRADLNLLKQQHFNVYEIHKIKNALEELFDKNEEQTLKLIQLSENKITTEISRQLAHDIRSPLAALNMLTTHAVSLPENQRILIRSAIGRINDIANSLATKASYIEKQGALSQSSDLSAELIPILIDSVVSEKRIQWRTNHEIQIHFEIPDQCHTMLATVSRADFQRIISNIIDNSVEALVDSAGAVTVSVKNTGRNLVIEVSDNGKGIPQSILPKLFQHGATFGKAASLKSGSGLGLYHAKTNVEFWGGNISIASELNRGTTVTITLNRSETPAWLLQELDLRSVASIVVIDDEKSIHDMWDERLREVSKQLKITHLSSAMQLSDYLSENNQTSSIFLCDHELSKSGVDGLSLVNSLKISERSVLVTSHHDNLELRLSTQKFGVKILPKLLVTKIPILS